MNEENKKPYMEWCPTMGGSTTAYTPEYLEGEEWKEIIVIKDASTGIPPPKGIGSMFGIVGLLGYEQAMAIAWWFAATHKAEKDERVAVRLQRHRFIYDIKASKTDMGVIELYTKGETL